MTEATYTIELIEGYKDGKGVVHRRVTFGKRLKGRDLMDIDADPQSNLQTQHQLLILRGGITEFGTLPIPVPLTNLLELTIFDFEALVSANNEFLDNGLNGRQPEFISYNEAKLPIGYERNGLVYNRVHFGNRVKAMYLVLAEQEG